MYYFKKELIYSTRPFNDNKMFYDLEEHRYNLTVAYVKTKVGIDLSEELGDIEKAKIFLDEVSEKVYLRIYSSTQPQYRQESIKIKEYKLACDHNIRDNIAKSMIALVRASIKYGILDIGDSSGYDEKTNTVADLSKIEDMPRDTIKYLTNTGIMYKGEYMYYIPKKEYRNAY